MAKVSFKKTFLWSFFILTLVRFSDIGAANEGLFKATAPHECATKKEKKNLLKVLRVHCPDLSRLFLPELGERQRFLALQKAYRACKNALPETYHVSELCLRDMAKDGFLDA